MFQQEAKVIDEGKEQVGNFLEECDRRIERLTKDYFKKFRRELMDNFRKFEPGITIRAKMNELITQEEMPQEFDF